MRVTITWFQELWILAIVAVVIVLPQGGVADGSFLEHRAPVYGQAPAAQTSDQHTPKSPQEQAAFHGAMEAFMKNVIRDKILVVIGGQPNISDIQKECLRSKMGMAKMECAKNANVSLFSSTSSPPTVTVPAILANTSIQVDPLNSLLQFELPENTKRAKLFILVRYKNSKKDGGSRVKGKGRRRDQRVQLLIQSPHPSSSSQNIATLNALVRHTKWQRIDLPRWSIQDALRDPQRLLSLKVTCTNCSPDGPQPVLLFRSNTVRRSISERGSRSRRQETRNKSYNKRRPYLLVKVGSKRSPRSLRDQMHFIPAIEDEAAPCSVVQTTANLKDMGFDYVLSPQEIVLSYCAGRCAQDDSNPISTAHFRHSHNISPQSCEASQTGTLVTEITYMAENNEILSTNVDFEQVNECRCSR